MGILIDLILILIIALSTFIGYKKGLIKVAIKILSFFIAIIIAFVLYKPVSSIIINNTKIDDNIKNAIITKIAPDEEEINQEVEVDLKNKVDNKIIKQANNTIEDIAKNFSIKIIEIVTLLLVFIVFKIILYFVTALADLIAKIPVLKQINKLGGTIYGVLKGIIIILVILAIIYLISPFLPENIIQIVDETIITKILYKHNILLNIII